MIFVATRLLRSSTRLSLLGLLTLALTSSYGCSDDDVDIDMMDVDASEPSDTGGTAKGTGGTEGTGGDGPSTGGGAQATGGNGPETGGAQGTGGEQSTGGGLFFPDDCPDRSVNQAPETLRCIGMYRDVPNKVLAPGVREFKPAYQLWSDGAEKKRWIYLPEGTQIDNTDANDWRMPNGTRLFKEFRWKGHLVETRLYEKQSSGIWVKATYHWNEGETAATRHHGGIVKVAGDDYGIPTETQCDECHKGRKDRSLGFDQLLLSLPGATGLTLQDLIDEDRLTKPLASGQATLGDDGTNKAADALGYMHVNCGVCCHNDNIASDAFSTGMFLRLPAEAADGRSPAGFDSLTTTIGIGAETGRWKGQPRIKPGDPSGSLVYHLMGLRDPSNSKDRMPPIGSVVVDTDGIKAVHSWIESLPPQ